MHRIRRIVSQLVLGIGLSAVVACSPVLALETKKDKEVVPTIAFGEVGQKKAEADSIRLIGHAACADVVEPSCDIGKRTAMRPTGRPRCVARQTRRCVAMSAPLATADTRLAAPAIPAGPAVIVGTLA